MDNETPNPETRQTLDIVEIMAILPHRYPFLLIDRVVEIDSQEAHRRASRTSPSTSRYFQGHFPGYPIMPGVLMVEAIAQAGGALLLTRCPDREDKLMVFTGIERAKFRRPVVPGDQLRIEIEVLNWKARAVRMEGKVFVEGKMACEAIVMCQLVPRNRETTSDRPPAAPARYPTPKELVTVSPE